MSRKQKSKQPHLAAANMPFTPMTHKVEKQPMATPFRPLQLNDLATPKINKSHSSADKEEFQVIQQKDPPPARQVDDNEGNSDISDLKQALLVCLQVVEKMEANELKSKKQYRTATTQTNPPPPKLPANYKQRKVTPSVENNNQFENMDKQKIKQQKQINKQSIEMSSKMSGNGSSSDAGDNDIQEKMRAMSLLLQKLQSRIDEIDESSQK